MNVGFILNFGLIFLHSQLIIKIQARETCLYTTFNGSTSTVSCPDECCSALSPSFQTACCTSVSLSTLAIPFFVVIGVCLIGICIIYCRPLWKMCFCGHRCPFGNSTRVSSPAPAVANDNPVFVLNNDDLPDYETITKDTTMKDATPPPYNFFSAPSHPDSSVPTAPPQYSSRPGSTISLQRPTTHTD